MKSSIRTILGYVAIITLFYSPVANGIRSSSSHTLSSLESIDRRIGRATVLNTRGGVTGDDALVSIVPRATLPKSISGGEIECVDEEAVATEEPAEVAVVKSSQWKDLTTRVLSAGGMIAFLVGLSVYFKETGLQILVVFLQAMMFGEMTRTIGGDDWGSLGATLRKYWWFATAAIAWNGPKIWLWRQQLLECTALTMTLLVGVVGSVLRFQRSGSGTVEFREYIRQCAVSLVSATLVIKPSSYWIGTLEEHGMKWIFVPAALVAINDIFAYVFGRLMGRHALLPSISPKKTWEGFIGAGLTTVGAAYAGLADAGGKIILGPGIEGISQTDGMILAGFASIIAPFAGFLASVIKRAYGRKDFGDAFPGHGGFVDRLDCQLLIAPFTYFYLSILKALLTTQS